MENEKEKLFGKVQGRSHFATGTSTVKSSGPWETFEGQDMGKTTEAKASKYLQLSISPNSS